MRLQDKVCVITGGAHGLGRGIARSFVDEGARVALNDIDASELQKALAEFGEERCIIRSGDAALASEADALTDAAAEWWGHIDVLVNNVGVVAFHDPTVLTEEQWDRIIDINLKSQWLWTRAALRYMLPQKSGSVIHMSSISAFLGQEFDGRSSFLYNVTKAGALQMARSFATRYASEGIRFNALCPGHFPTEIVRRFWSTDKEWEKMYQDVAQVVPLRRPGRVEELAAGAVFLASNESSYMTGQALVIDGGILVKHP